MIYSIEELNEIFMRQLTAQQQAKKLQNWKKAAGALVVLLLTCLLIWCKTVAYYHNQMAEVALPTVIQEDFLSSGERQKWKSGMTEEELIPIELNQQIEVHNQRAFTRIVNPVYSRYAVRVTIMLKENREEILYQSEKLSPGTVLEAVQLSRTLTAESNEAVIEYVIYDQEDKILGTYPVEAKLIQINEENQGGF